MRITIPLTAAEKTAIIELAEKEYRTPRQQAALLIRRQLENLGLLPTGPTTNNQSAGGEK